MGRVDLVKDMVQKFCCEYVKTLVAKPSEAIYPKTYNLNPSAFRFGLRGLALKIWGIWVASGGGRAR